MSDVRTLLERGVGGATPPPDGLERLLRRRDRKRRNQRISAGVVGIAVFVAAVWVVTTAGPFDRTRTPANTGPSGPTGPRPHPVGVGLLGLPSEGAPPSVPERGELVLGFGFGHTAGDPGRFSLHVYADGRLIWQRLADFHGGANASSTGLIEQRLTPEGVDLVLAEVLSTGLFDRDRELVGAGGLHYGEVGVRAADRFVHLTWGNAGFEEGDEPIATTPSQELVRAIEGLDARLEDLVSWLPARAWEDPEFRAYVPSRYHVCYLGRGERLARPRILDLLPAAADDLLGTLDTTRSDVNGSRGAIPFWCSVVTTEEARFLAEILEDAGAVLQSSEDPSYAFSPSGRPPFVIDIGLEPLLPHER